MRINILDIPIDCLSEHDVLTRIMEFCRTSNQHHIATPNPEMLVESQQNPEFKHVLNETALNLPDGIGLVWALRRAIKKQQTTTKQPQNTNTPSPRSGEGWGGASRITGTDTLQQITSLDARLCPPERIFLLGAAPGIAEKAAEILMQRNPAIREIGTHAGSPHTDKEEEIIKKINAFSPTLLFVAYGAPAQDLWIARNLKKMPTVKVAMGVGGAFDFIVGKQKRAPKLMRKMGLEWLWRLILEPKRLGRIWNATIIFPLLVFRHGSDEAS